MERKRRGSYFEPLLQRQLPTVCRHVRMEVAQILGHLCTEDPRLVDRRGLYSTMVVNRSVIMATRIADRL